MQNKIPARSGRQWHTDMCPSDKYSNIKSLYSVRSRSFELSFRSRCSNRLAATARDPREINYHATAHETAMEQRNGRRKLSRNTTSHSPASVNFNGATSGSSMCQKQWINYSTDVSRDTAVVCEIDIISNGDTEPIRIHPKNELNAAGNDLFTTSWRPSIMDENRSAPNNKSTGAEIWKSESANAKCENLSRTGVTNYDDSVNKRHIWRAPYN